jgi:hypothetical protein
MVACSGGGSTPTAPSTPTATSITVASTGTSLFLGATETFTATVTLSNGTTQALTGGTWSSDATGVATVVGTTGAVTGISSGEVTVIVDAQGVRGTKRIRVLPRYQGIWFGNYTVNTCAQTGDFIAADLCGTVLIVGNTLSAGLNFSQNGASITGQTLLGSLFSDSLTATVATNGSLPIQVGATLPGFTTRVNQAWQLTITQAGRIDGSLTQTWTEPGLTGQVVATTTLSNFVPSSQAFALPSGPRWFYGSARDAIAGMLRGR